MRRSKFSEEQILAIVKEGEAGRKVADLSRAHGITEQTYYRWKAKYGGLELSEMRKLPRQVDTSHGDFPGEVGLGRNISGGTRPRLSWGRSWL